MRILIRDQDNYLKLFGDVQEAFASGNKIYFDNVFWYVPIEDGKLARRIIYQYCCEGDENGEEVLRRGLTSGYLDLSAYNTRIFRSARIDQE